MKSLNLPPTERRAHELELHRARCARYRSTHKAEIFAHHREVYNPTKAQKNHWRDRYSLTPEEVFSLLAAQNYRCKICAVPIAVGENAHIDHDHTTKEVRGILCGLCNKGLGQFKDSLTILKKAVIYLTK